MTADNYYNDNTAISKHGLDKMEISPLDYWWAYINPLREPYVPSKDTLFDEALRMAILTPDRFATKYARMPKINKSTTTGKMEFAAITKSIETNNQLSLSVDDYDNIINMRNAAANNKLTKVIFSNGVVGIPKMFEEPESGAQIKFRPHWIHNGVIINLTSTTDPSEANFSKEAQKFHWHRKAALQIDGFGARSMAFVVIEKTAPYKIGMYYLDDRSLALGRETYIRNARKYAECLESGIWPGLPEKITASGLPNWAFKNNY